MSVDSVKPKKEDEKGATLLVQLAIVNPAQAIEKLTPIFAAARMFLEKDQTDADQG